VPKIKSLALNYHWKLGAIDISMNHFIIHPKTFSKVYELGQSNEFAPLEFQNIRKLTEILGFDSNSGKARNSVDKFFEWYEKSEKLQVAPFFYRQNGHLHFSHFFSLYFEKYFALYKSIPLFSERELFALKLFHTFLKERPFGGIKLSIGLPVLMEEMGGTSNKSYFKRVLKRNLEILIDKNLINSWELDDRNNLLKVDVVYQGEKLRLIESA